MSNLLPSPDHSLTSTDRSANQQLPAQGDWVWTCFVISQIGKPDSAIRKRSDYVLKHIILRALAPVFDRGRIERADEMRNGGRVDDALIRQVLEADLVIADLTDNNPNVCFEFGIRYTLARKPFICLCQQDQIDQLPFDYRQVHMVSLPNPLGAYGEGGELDHRRDEDRAVAELGRKILRLKENESDFWSPLGKQAKTLEELAAAGDWGDTQRAVLDKLSRIETLLTTQSQIATATSGSERDGECDLMTRGRRLIESREFGKAVDILTLAAAQDRNEVSLFYLAFALAGNKKTEEAKRVLNEVLEMDPEFQKAKDLRDSL